MSLRDLAKLKLADKRSELVELFPDHPHKRAMGIIRAQKLILTTIASQWEAGYPARVVVLKARRLGVSTFTDLWQMHWVSERPNRQAFVCAHNADASEELFDRARIAHEYTGDKRPLKASSRREIAWDVPHGSKFSVKTAGIESLKRGATLHHVHCSELAFWPNQRQTMLSVFQCVPEEPDTSILVESTANGAGDEFNTLWDASRSYAEAERTDRWDGWIGIFLSWLDNPEEYSLPVPRGYDWAGVEPEVEEDEPELRRLGATAKQLYWRRRKIDEACAGRVDDFRQEYPAWPEQAFLMSGRRAIPAAITRGHRATVEPPRLARLVSDADAVHGVRAVFSESLRPPCWEIWREPLERFDYALGGDVATGKPSSPTDEHSDPDYSAAIVLERQRIETVAQWVGRIPTDEFGEEMLKAALYYNRAWCSPEANSLGVAVINVFKAANYDRLFTRTKPDQWEFDDLTHLLGWITTGGANGTRDGMIDGWISACRANAEEFGFTMTLLNHSERLVEQEERFIYNKDGKRMHRPNCHDDVLFAAMIALQMHRRCPRTREPAPSEWRQDKVTAADIRFVGGRDLGAQILATGGSLRKDDRMG